MSAAGQPQPQGNGCLVFNPKNPACTIYNTTVTPATPDPYAQPCGACSGNTGNPFGYGGPKPAPSLPPCVQAKSCVGVLPNKPGTHCHDSISGASENVPTNTSDWGHQVYEIDTVSATISVIGGYGSTATGPMGYIYVDNNGQWYLGESPSYTGNAWQVLGSQFGFIGDFLTGEQDYGKNFDQPITPAQVQQMKGLHNGQTIGVAPCVVPETANA